MKNTTLILIVLTILWQTGCKEKQSSETDKKQLSKKVRIETVIAKTDQPETVLNYSGIIVPYLSTSLSFQLPGQVKGVYVDQGSRVRKGQLLAELDKTSAENAYKIALAMQEQAQDAYERLKTVYDKGSLPEIQWEEMKSKLTQANASLIIARQSLEHTKIFSPEDGVIGSRNVEVGSTATPGITVLELLNIEKVYVRISVPENEIMKISLNQTASVSIPAIGAQLFQAKVEKIGVEANLISKTYEVKLVIENPGLKIKPGMACDINLKSEDNGPMISLPYNAVNKDSEDQPYVFKVDTHQKKARKLPVTVYGFSNNEVTISDGVKAGDMIVVKGQHKLHDNDEVIF